MELLRRMGDAFLAEDLVVLFSDDERLAAWKEIGAPFVDPELETTLIGDESTTFGPYLGIDGLIQGWREWLEMWASYRAELEDVLELDGRIVVLVRQRGRTFHGDAEVPGTPSALVCTIRDGWLVQAKFYLDRRDAERLEGIEIG